MIRVLVTASLLMSIALSAIRPALAEDGKGRRPNIVFILADDLGYTDVACYGSRYYETPNIDRLASQGIRLLAHHHCQNCAPTRAALMTGQYGPRTGVYTVGGTQRFDTSDRPLVPVENVQALPLDRKILPQPLQTAGYVTGMFGKWHLGERNKHHPADRGFDEAIVSDGAHFDFKTNPAFEVPAGQYLADFLTDRAVDFIRRHKDESFFLYLPHFGVHSPYQAKPDLIERFKGKPAVAGHHDPTYAAMIASVDDSVGRVMQTLDELKLAENTVVIFASDNGGVGGYRREGIVKGAGEITDNAPLRSGKGSLYEGGTRVPLIARWPGVIPAAATSETPTIHVDLFPTIIELAGASPPDQPVDGESLVPLWRDPKASLKREAIFQHFPGYLGAGKGFWRTTPVSLIQEGNWKLMEFLEDGRVELYDLKTDPGESKNLAESDPDRASRMSQRLLAWRDGIKAPMPQRKEPGKATEPAPEKKPGKKAKKKPQMKEAASAATD